MISLIEAVKRSSSGPIQLIQRILSRAHLIKGTTQITKDLPQERTHSITFELLFSEKVDFLFKFLTWNILNI